MKKTLLSLFAVALFTNTSSAITTTTTYENVNGLSMKNICAISSEWDTETFDKIAALKSTGARTSCILNGVIYVACSSSKTIDKFDAMTGKHLGTLNSAANSWMQNLNIGVDNYGNLYVTGLMSSSNFNLRVINPEDGSLIGEVINLQKNDANYRVDYFDIIGDVTRENDGCIIMGSSTQTSTEADVACWKAEKGGDFEYSKIVCNENEVFSTGSVLKIKLGKGEKIYQAEQFWVDGLNQIPILFNNDGTVARKITAISPELGTNGVEEFTIGSHNLLAVSMIAPKNGAASFSILECTETTGDMTTNNTTELWNVTGLHGTNSDGNTYIHCLSAEKYIDNNGKEAVILVSQKAANGFGAYFIAEEGFNDNIVDIEETMVDVNAPVEYYNLQGVKVANPENGIFIKKQGAKTSKVVL